MGHRFSHFRGPQVTLEGNAHALIRVGWDSQYEHEHGLTPEFVDIASGGRVAKLEANEWFKLALQNYPAVPDKIRILLQQADARRREGTNKPAIKLLDKIIADYPTAPETEAARAWLQQLRPAP